MVRHLWLMHYGIHWRCVSCEMLHDEREEALMCSHGQQGNKKRLKVGPPASPVPRQAGPVRDPVPRRPAEIVVAAPPPVPGESPQERDAFVEKCRHMLAQLGVPDDRMPLNFTLAATPALIRGLSEAQLRSLTKQFVEAMARQEQHKGRGGYDLEWRAFVMERSMQQNPVAPLRRMTAAAGPGPRVIPRVQQQQQLQQVAGKAPPTAPAVVLNNPGEAAAASSASAAAAAASAAASEADVSLEDLLVRAKRAVALLDESDTQLRYALNLLASSRRRISDLDSSSRVLKKRLADANQQLVVTQTQNRDLRVKMLYDDREHHRQVERLARESKEGQGISVESAYAINQLKDLKQELLQLSPVFPEKLIFEMVEVSFAQAVSLAPPQRHGTVRATRDLSGRRWVVWSDLRQGASAALLAILNQPDALPKP